MRRSRCLVLNRRKENVRSSNSVKTPSVQLRPFLCIDENHLSDGELNLSGPGEAWYAARQETSISKVSVVTSLPSREGLRRQEKDSPCKGNKNILIRQKKLYCFLLFFLRGGIRRI